LEFHGARERFMTCTIVFTLRFSLPLLCLFFLSNFFYSTIPCAALLAGVICFFFIDGRIPIPNTKDLESFQQKGCIFESNTLRSKWVGVRFSFFLPCGRCRGWWGVWVNGWMDGWLHYWTGLEYCMAIADTMVFRVGVFCGMLVERNGMRA